MSWTSSSDGKETGDAYENVVRSHQETMRRWVDNIMMYRETVRISRWNYPRDMSSCRLLYQ
jgi:hypothetical protein